MAVPPLHCGGPLNVRYCTELAKLATKTGFVKSQLSNSQATHQIIAESEEKEEEKNLSNTLSCLECLVQTQTSQAKNFAICKDYCRCTLMP